jgi:hypothetical protein
MPFGICHKTFEVQLDSQSLTLKRHIFFETDMIEAQTPAPDWQ